MKFFRIFSALSLAGMLLLCPNPCLHAQPRPDTYKVDLDYYLPADWKYTLDTHITTPEQYLGFPLGSQHVDWSQVVGYMHLLAKESPRFSIKTGGRTYENRPLIYLTVTSPDNQQHLEQIRSQHLQVLQGTADQGPVVVCVGSSVHGNEPSGVQGAIVVAYFLAAAQGPEVEQMLRESIILLIPGYNPDGINRFASWVNANKTLSNTGDPQSREFHEAGPASRYNHYWHDLNRDWLFLEHPETRFAVSVFHEWLPNVMSDHHEMGSNSTFFFSPGDPHRVHSQLPTDNQQMAGIVARYIQENLERLGSKFYSLRGYDDYYIGKGAAYGDVQGSVCLLTEQASSRGHYQTTKNGLLTFPFTIRNQSAAQFAVIRAAWKEKQTFQQYMQRFYRDLPQQNTSEGIAFTAHPSRAVTWHFLHMLHQHHIKVYTIDGGLKKKETTQGYRYFIPFRGNNPALVHTLMDANLNLFGDSVFYDISAWTLPMAYHLNYETLHADRLTLREITEFTFPQGHLNGHSDIQTYTFDTRELYAPAMVYALQQQGAKLRVKEGHICAEIREDIIRRAAERFGVEVAATSQRPDTTQYRPLRQPRVGIITVNNRGASTVGTYWHLTDYRLQLQPALLDAAQLAQTDLSQYNTLIITASIPKEDKAVEKLAQWIADGGTLISANAAHGMLKRMGMDILEEKPLGQHTLSTKSGFPGGILQMKMNRKSPLTWNLDATEYPVFKMATTTFKENAKAIFTFSGEPLSGYFAPAYMQNIAGTPAVAIAQKGKGIIIYFNISVAFRSYFYSSMALLSNAILYGQYCIDE